MRLPCAVRLTAVRAAVTSFVRAEILGACGAPTPFFLRELLLGAAGATHGYADTIRHSQAGGECGTLG